MRDRGAIAQLGERLDRTQEVGGSSPPSSIAEQLLRRGQRRRPSRPASFERHRSNGGRVGSFARRCCEVLPYGSRRKDCGSWTHFEYSWRTTIGSCWPRSAVRSPRRKILRSSARSRSAHSSPQFAIRTRTWCCSTCGCPNSTASPCLERLRKYDPTIAVVIPRATATRRRSRQPVREVPAATSSRRSSPSISRRSCATRSRAVVRGVGSGGGAGRRRRSGETVLSERETAVLDAVARGLSNREIGRQLWISEQTVKFHLRNVYRKLGISSRTEAARYAYRTGRVAALTIESA